MIISKTNELIKYIKSLHKKSNRDVNNEYIVEGIKMVYEAIESNMQITKILICEELFNQKAPDIKCDIQYVSKGVFEYISDTETPQGILAILKKKDTNSKRYGDVIFALDTLQDPGNMGTIIRTLDCTGIKTLLLSNGCVDAYSPKVVRSTMGAIYRIDIFQNINLIEKLAILQKERI